MIRRALTILCLLLLPCAAAGQGIAGAWSGKLELGGGNRLTVVFHISETEEGYSATMDSPDQGACGMPTTSASFAGNRLTISAEALSMTYEGILLGNMVSGTMTQLGQRMMLNLTRGKPEVNRPQNPAPPYPYETEEVVFHNPEAGINLAGTLSYPRTGGNFPAVVMITGSGAQNRDEEIFEHKPFFVIADHFTRNGIAVLRFDDRGTAASEGDFRSATSADLATDAVAAVRYLRGRQEVNPSKIGLLGHSEGGLIAFMIAGGEQSEEIAFVVSMAGAAVRGDLLMKEQRQLIMTAQGAPQEYIDMNEGFVEKTTSLIREHGREEVFNNAAKYAGEVFPAEFASDEQQRASLAGSVAQMASPWMWFFANYDPAADMENTVCPVLAVNGEKDLQVSAYQNLSAIEKHVKNNLMTIRYPGLNHLFQHCTSGLSTEYGQIEETISPEVLNDMAEWILRVTRRP